MNAMSDGGVIVWSVRRSKMQEDFLRLRALLLDLFRARHFLVEINDSTDVGQQ